MSQTTQCYPSEKTYVEIIEGIGEWFVRIVEHGEVTAIRSFGTESVATSFADGQRLRLRLDPGKVRRW